jgi:hypothetical protein
MTAGEKPMDTKFWLDAGATALDTAAFFFVTTDLYGSKLDVAQRLWAGVPLKTAAQIAHDLEGVAQTLGFDLWYVRFILWVYQHVPFKRLLLYLGVLLFLGARGLSLTSSALSG